MSFTSVTITPPAASPETHVPVLDGTIAVRETKPVTIFAGFQYRQHNILRIEAESPNGKKVEVLFQRPDGRWLPIELGSGESSFLPPELAWLTLKENTIALGAVGEKATREQVEKATAPAPLDSGRHRRDELRTLPPHLARRRI